MSEIILPIKEMSLNHSFLDHIFNFDYQKLDTIEDLEVSKYCIALAQYNVYLKYQINITKAETIKKRRFIDAVVFKLLSPDILKKYKTKADAREYIVTTDPELTRLRTELEEVENELLLTNGIDVTIQELINAFKRELSRRENELQTTRMERR